MKHLEQSKEAKTDNRKLTRNQLLSLLCYAEELLKAFFGDPSDEKIRAKVEQYLKEHKC